MPDFVFHFRNAFLKLLKLLPEDQRVIFIKLSGHIIQNVKCANAVSFVAEISTCLIV